MKTSDILRIYYNNNSPHEEPAMVVMREEQNKDLYLLHAIRGKDAVEIYKKLTKGAMV